MPLANDLLTGVIFCLSYRCTDKEQPALNPPTNTVPCHIPPQSSMTVDCSLLNHRAESIRFKDHPRSAKSPRLQPLLPFVNILRHSTLYIRSATAGVHNLTSFYHPTPSSSTLSGSSPPTAVHIRASRNSSSSRRYARTFYHPYSPITTHTFILTDDTSSQIAPLKGKKRTRGGRDDDDDRRMTCDGGFFSWAWMGCGRRAKKTRRAL